MRIGGLAAVCSSLLVAGSALAQPSPGPADPYDPGPPAGPSQPPPADRSQPPGGPTQPPPPPPDGQEGPYDQQQPPRDRQQRPAQRPERLPEIPSRDFTDWTGYLGVIAYQRRNAFQRRDGGLVLGAESHRLFNDLLYSSLDAEIGVSGDSEDKDNGGFRYRFDYLIGIGFGYGSGALGLGVGLGMNGETEAIPVALTVPIEIRATNWLAPSVRSTVFVRGDRFVAAYNSREVLADGYWQADELMVGARLGFIGGRGKRRGGLIARSGPVEDVLKGFSFGFSYHRTMGSGLWMFTLGVTSTTVPGASIADDEPL